MDTHTHVGQEVRLLSQGLKPLAAFVEFLPRDSELDLFPREELEQLVRGGSVVTKYADFPLPSEGSGEGYLRRTVYALPEQAWRMDAYLALWRLAERTGWLAGYEMLEGYLLGLHSDVDPFFSPQSAFSQNAEGRKLQDDR